MPLLGIKASLLNEFIAKAGGRGIFRNMTTRTVVEKMVLRDTNSFRGSYLELLKRQGKCEGKETVVKEASVFVSHPWKGEFLYTVDAIMQTLERLKLPADGTFLWMDIFSLSQHGAFLLPSPSSSAVPASPTPSPSPSPSPSPQPRPPQWFSSALPALLAKMHHFLLVFQPDNPSLTLSRAWCIYEVHATTHATRPVTPPVTLAIPHDAYSKLFESIARKPGDLLAMVQRTPLFSSAQCTQLADLTGITAYLTKQVMSRPMLNNVNF